MKYRKKPVEVYAEQFYDNKEDMARLCELGLDYVRVHQSEVGPVLTCGKFVGTSVKEGDYIVKTSNGDFYPMDKATFERTYEAVQ